MQWAQTIRKLGPGFLFAGAAIGVSHLVQSTRAGADFGLGLLWALLLINLAKYPFFEFGPRYAMATGESLLEGYKKLGRPALIAYFVITLATMFTIQTAVTIVTSGIASSLFGGQDTTLWSAIITGICFLILILGRYRVLDSLMKIIIICLTISTLIAVALALTNNSDVNWQQQLPDTAMGIGFLIAFMGWMPAPLDISIWHSMWTLEKKKITDSITPKQSRFDFNVGYIATVILAICFLLLGGLVMFGSGQQFSSRGAVFANQLIEMYTVNLGEGTRYIIGIAALTTMFSTTLTTLDASPRAMARTTELLRDREMPKAYLTWLIILVLGTTGIFVFLTRVEGLMGILIEVATVLSFLTAPFYAGLNLRLVTSKHMPEQHKPSKPLYILAWIGMLTLISFSIWYLFTL
ncbi:Nramp family divalent metal transporter [Gilvibacter sediminis]|uniref:Nramp family divalent metal transporter n=1 Tax=Gilvibacter sediminis TaxID=379071 RepID=UPI0023501351|nr:Nramp family divalent metal transporter [Gilvibacter sediminis]MDC7998543.1 Nramp family divalent metal transporter [Gilvibacter sediminis]